MSGLTAYLFIWSKFALLGLAIAAPIVFLSRRRVKWQWWELLGLVLPYWFWVWLDAAIHRPKSLANIGELGSILVGMVVLALLRAAVGKRRSALVLAIAGQVALLGIATLEYFLTPMLPE